MKIGFILLTMVALAGCSGAPVTLNTDTTQVAVTTAARALGYKIAALDPKLIPAAKIYCQSLESGNITQALGDGLRAYLTERFKDPLLAASVSDVFKLVKINNVYDTSLVKIAAAAALEGITLYEQGQRPAAAGSVSGGIS